MSKRKPVERNPTIGKNQSNPIPLILPSHSNEQKIYKAPAIVCALFAILFLFLLTSCSNNKNVQDERVYFDFPGYIQDQIVVLKEQNTILKKRIVSQEQEEIKIIESPDLETELKLLLEQDLNRSSNYNMYIVDSIRSSDSLVVSYKSIDQDISPSYLRIASYLNEIKDIKIKSSTSGSLASSTLKIRYTGNQGYTISKYNNSTFGDNFNFELYVDFIN